MAEEDSSDGVLGSSEDEIYEGISEAVGYHIEQQEHAASRESYADQNRNLPSYWPKEGRRWEEEYGLDREWGSGQPRWHEREYNRMYPAPLSPSGHHQNYDNMPYRQEAPWKNPLFRDPGPGGRISPSRSYLATPRTELMLQNFKHRRATPPPLTREYSAPSTQFEFSHSRIAGPSLPPHIGNLRQDQRILGPKEDDYRMHGPRYINDEAPHLKIPKSKGPSSNKKMRKPILFRIKENTPPRNLRSAPLFSSFSDTDLETHGRYEDDSKATAKNKDPKIYEQNNNTKYIDNNEENGPPSKTFENVKKNLIKRREDFNRTSLNHKEKKSKRRKSRSRQKELRKSEQSEPQKKVKGHPEANNEPFELLEGDVVYEEEVVEEDVDKQLSGVESEDEELLGLRLTALTSALNKSKSEKSDKGKAKGKSKKKKTLKSKPLRRVTRSSAKGDAKNKKRRSAISDMFLKKYTDITRERSPTDDIESKLKPEKTLTLFGEIVKNQTKSSSEALRYIRSLPDSKKKTEMFLKLMEPDKDKRTQENGLSWKDSACKNVTEEAAPPEQKDNYEEIEMDIEADEDNENGAIGICPPGTIEVVNIPNHDQAERHPAVSVPDTGVSCDDILTNSIANATPSQESIWSMLESPVGKTTTPQIQTEKDGAVAEKTRDGTFFREAEIDDSELGKLRASLLKQIVKKSDTTEHQPNDIQELLPDPASSETKVVNTDQPSGTISGQLEKSEMASMSSNAQEEPIPPPPLPPLPLITGTLSLPKVPLPWKLSPQVFEPNSASTPLLPSDSINMTTAAKRRRKRQARKRKKKLLNLAKLKQEDKKAGADAVPPTQIIDNSPKTRTPNFNPASTQKVTESKVIYKSATTLIKKNTTNMKRTRPTVPPIPPPKVRVVSHPQSRPTMMKLPRHQPVVINLVDSSDEEDATEPLPPKEPPAASTNSPLSMLDAMIHQARLQTDLNNEKAKTQGSEGVKSKEVSSSKRSNDTWPFAVPTDGSQSSITSQELDNLPTSLLAPTESKKSTDTNKTSNPLVKKPIAKITSSINEEEKLPRSPGDERMLMQSRIRQTRTKFLKVKSLIQKDESAMKKLVKTKDSREAELKMVQDELQEMVLRVAAIKGKAARCEKVVVRYRDQEEKLKERLKKRHKLRETLKERLKKELVAVQEEKKRMDEKTVKEKAMLETAKKKEQQEKLEQEKRRLLVVQQKLAARINLMRKKEGSASPQQQSPSRRRVSLSREVRSHLEKYKESVKVSNPSAHDLSLSKITISSLSPVRNPQTAKAAHSSPEKSSSPVRNVSKTLDGPCHDETKTALDNEIESSKEKCSKTSAISESSRKQARNYIQQQMSDTRAILEELESQVFTQPSIKKSWDPPVPDCIKTLKIDFGDLVQDGREKSGRKTNTEFQPYQSPLLHFRSYRFSPFLRTKCAIPISSRTTSNKIDPEKILCRYDLTGTCNDDQCTAQHRTDYEMSDQEILLDLMLYCPVVLGVKPTPDNIQDSLENVEPAFERLCGINRSKNPSMTAEQRCVLATSKINTALGNKAPFTTIFKPRAVRMKQTSRSDAPILLLERSGEADDNRNPGGSRDSGDTEDEFENPDEIGTEQRYFVGESRKGIHSLEAAVKHDPHNADLWIQLAKKRVQSGAESKGLELALHTMCLALEDNPYVGKLWAHYLGLLGNREGTDCHQDFEEMASQALELVPLSPDVWKQLLSLESSIMKRELLYDRLIVNLLKQAENSEEDPNSSVSDIFASSWLLQTVLERTQLHNLSRGPEYALRVLEMTVTEFSQQCRSASMFFSSKVKRCLAQSDLCHLWLAMINLKHFHCLPASFVVNSCTSTTNLGVLLNENAEVRLHFNLSKELTEKLFSEIHCDINNALTACSYVSVAGRQFHIACCSSLVRELVRLEIAQGHWKSAANTCQNLYQSLVISDSGRHLPMFSLSQEESQRQLTEVALIWADILLWQEQIVQTTQVFDTVLTENASNAQLAYEAALYQLNQSTKDMDAAILYFESCAKAFLQFEHEGLKLPEICKLFRFLLRLPGPLKGKKLVFHPGVDWNTVKRQKPYLWLIYCTLMELSGEPVRVLLELYEHALIEVEDDKGEQAIWIRFLKYKLSLAPAQNAKTNAQALKQKRNAWFRNFTALVCRCLTYSHSRPTSESTAILNPDSIDYTFHNKVVDIYMSCLHTRQQMSAAYSLLTDLLPYNIQLLLRACEHYLGFRDHASVSSVLWKATLKPICQNRTIWKM